MITAADYAEFLAVEYLDTYIAAGGAAVKFVVAADPGDADRFSRNVRDGAAAGGYVTVLVDAVDVRVHMMDQVFFAVARQIDWDGLAAHRVRAAFAAVDYPVAADAVDISVEAVAAHHRVDPGELNRDVNRQLQQQVFHDYAMVQEFRVAMLRLCQAQLRTGQVTEAEHTAVLEWLRGELRQISLLRSAMNIPSNRTPQRPTVGVFPGPLGGGQRTGGICSSRWTFAASASPGGPSPRSATGSTTRRRPCWTATKCCAN